MRFLLLAAVAGLVGGCATAGAVVQPVNIKGDSLCEVGREISYVPSDDPETIYEIRTHNKKLKAACGKSTRPPISYNEYLESLS